MRMKDGNGLDNYNNVNGQWVAKLPFRCHRYCHARSHLVKAETKSPLIWLTKEFPKLMNEGSMIVAVLCSDLKYVFLYVGRINCPTFVKRMYTRTAYGNGRHRGEGAAPRRIIKVTDVLSSFQAAGTLATAFTISIIDELAIRERRRSSSSRSTRSRSQSCKDMERLAGLDAKGAVNQSAVPKDRCNVQSFGILLALHIWRNAKTQ